MSKKIYLLFMYVLLGTSYLMAQTPPCTVYPTPSIQPSFIAFCQEPPKDPAQPQPATTDPQDPRKDPLADCFRACENQLMSYATVDSGNDFVWEVFGDASYTPVNSFTQPVTWLSPGTGLVQVTETTPDGCSTTTSICVVIVEAPLVDFTSIPPAVNDEIFICEGGEVHFTDASSDDVITWVWDFGDGASSNDPNPSHQYTTAGTYVVTLTVFNDCGCSAVKEVKVIVEPTAAPIIACISTVCAGDQGTYSVTNACDNATFTWTAVGGTVVNPNANPVTVNWANPSSGQGLLTVVVNGCGNTCPIPSTVIVPILTPNLTMSGPEIVCIGDLVEYTIPAQPSTTFNWTMSPNFPYQFSAAPHDHSAEVEWTALGTFTICVEPSQTLDELKCKEYDPICMDVYVKSPFTIEGNLTEICEGENVTFQTTPLDNAINEMDQTTWQAIESGGSTYNLGIGDVISNNTLPAGSYEIQATNTVDTFICNTVAQTFLIVKPAAPLYDMADLIGDLTICPNSSQNYMATPEPGYFLTWSAVGGTVLGSGNEVAITWGPAPPYSISITQESMIPPSCPSVATVTVNELIPGTPTISGFNQFCTDGTGGFGVPLSYDVTLYEWEIIPANIGSVITGQNTNSITVQFNNTPNPTTVIQLSYTVCDQVYTVQKTVNVANQPNITLNIPTEACQNESPGTSMSASIPGSVTGTKSWSWDFGTSGAQTTGNSNTSNVSFSFPNYGTEVVTVTLTVTGGSCPGTYTASQLVNIKPAPLVNITAQFGNTLCPSNNFMTTLVASVQNAAGNPGGNYSYQWNTGSTNPSINVSTPGTYTLTVFDIDTGCSTTEDYRVYPCPSGGGPCLGANITSITNNCNDFDFTGFLFNGYTFNPSWSFGDGNGANGLTASYTYPHSGYYTVTFSGRNSSGDVCTDVETIEIPFVPYFITEFSCPGNNILVDLINQTDHLPGVDNNLSYHWEDALGATVSNLENPTGIDLSTFTQPITFEVFYNNPSGPNYTCAVTETINVPTPIVADFDAIDGLCEGSTVFFTNTSAPLGISATWDFGDGSGSNLIPAAQRTYAFDPGGIMATLTVVDEFGCTDQTQQPIIVHENTLIGNVDVTGYTVPTCPTINLTADPGGLSYNWFLVEDTGLDSPAGNTVNSDPISTTGNYYVIVTDGLGCSEQSANQEVVVIPPPVAFILGELSYCPDEPILLSANQGGDYTYLWNVSPAVGGLVDDEAQLEITNPIPGQTYTISVTVTNTATMCATTSPNVTVVVEAQPWINIPFTFPACAPATVTSNYSSDITSWIWSTGSTIDETEVLGGGTVQVTGYTDAGCSATDELALGDGPDISDVAVGCYCFSEEVLWTAPSGFGYSYAWYEVGVTGIQGTGQQFLIDHSGIYYVEVTDYTGCVSTSDPIIVDIGGDCGKCGFEVRPLDLVCVGLDPNTGGTIYSFTTYILNYFSSLNGMTGYSNEGIVTSITPTAIPGNGAVTQITGTFILLPGFTDAVITFEGAGAEGIHCDYKLYVPKFPDCGTSKPCDVDWKDPKIECLYNYNGWNYYSFSITANNNGSLINDLVMYPCHSPKVIITSSTSTISGGSTIINGIIKAEDWIANDCFNICGWDVANKKLCCWKINFNFPQCKTITPCPKVTIKSKNIWCIQPLTDVQGNNVYHFNIQATSTHANADAVYLIPYISQASNHVSDLVVNTSGNNYQITGTIFDVPSYNDPLCFILVVIKDGKPCQTKICFKVPEFCLGPGGNRSADTDDAQTKNQFIDDEIMLKVAPNPAKDVLMVDYKTSFKGDTALKLIGLDGQIVRIQSQINTAQQIAISLSEIPKGMYFLGIYEDGILKAQEKVVVLGD